MISDASRDETKDETENIYDEAGRDLLQRLGIDPDSTVSDTDNVNLIYRSTGNKQAAIYVGDQRVAK